MSITILPSRTEEIVKKIEKGDYSGISLEEYMQVSFLTLISGEEQHIEEKVMYGGNVFQLHACVHQVVPGADVAALRNKV